MKQILTILGVFSIILLIGCAVPELQITEEELTDADIEAMTEPTAEQIEADLDTSSLDEIEGDLDLLILE
ncbi:hypothetical protein CMO88_00175 [Candidatus Woesearchaeota archaeon]|nr:hypothetical protein [Candidatus Woesearchaeota archaeon]|tara:strand:- start:23081 stop:23290 length:210 start_codon:yes stop_codon:yes gene_type:complete